MRAASERGGAEVSAVDIDAADLSDYLAGQRQLEIAHVFECSWFDLSGPCVELPEREPMPPFIPQGRVYFVQAVRAPKRIKVGFSSNVDVRFASLRSACPYNIRMLGHIRGTRVTEAALHEFLRPYRTHGEWFENRRDVRVVLARLLLSGAR